METLIIDYNQKSPVKKTILIIFGLYFLIFCGYFAFNEAAISRYGLLFYVSIVGAVLALLVFLSYTLWASSKKLLIIDQTRIESNIPSYKFKEEWINVSRVDIVYDAIIIHTNGGRKEKRISLLDIHLKDVNPIKNKMIEFCKYKSIAYTNE